ncbi:DUF1566 domain-containing protein [Vibrio parahaemolyticus]|uniref:Lcl domain-containing protein n=1 Tax=Vibrio parahaemolyticus TaxID=670 RepID=UPI0004B76D35|nr:DUF1566 domain-containing protein [Vibrio parahaemolyticus]
MSISVTPEEVQIVDPFDTEQLTVIGTYDDSSTDDVTDQVTWSVVDNTIAVISNDGVVSAGTSSDSETTATALLNGITSNTVNITTCNTFAGPCIDTIDIGSGKLFTNSPSVPYLDSIGGSVNDGTYFEDGSDGPTGDFYLFTWDNATPLCETYNTQNVAGRTNWRLPDREELVELFNTFGNMFTGRGWPTPASYWSTTAGDLDTHRYSVYLNDGLIRNQTRDYPIYVSCVSDPS